MTNTLPLPGSGSEDEKQRIGDVITRRGLVGAANDHGWACLLDVMRHRDGWKPSYRYKSVDGPISEWDVEWWYHLPLP